MNSRKSIVFHVLYGTHPGATETELRAWRAQAVEYLNGLGPMPPLTLQMFRDGR